jgi:hypothetical protein
MAEIILNPRIVTHFDPSMSGLASSQPLSSLPLRMVSDDLT